jgi:VCBS repeat-containing protein
MAVSTVSYTKTPQAGDDVYNYGEDDYLAQLSSTGTILLDVMSNDLGGNAKKLYSIDNGDALKDLLTKDPGLTTAWESTADGNQIRISNGKIEFKLAEGVDINKLADGEQYQDSFTYAIQLGNGTISYATVKLNITGQNDAAVLSSADVTLDETDAALSASGQLTVADIDNGQSFFKAQSDVQGSHGKFSIGADGNWIYTADEAFDNLNVGDSVFDTFEVESADGTKTSVKVTINGTNDAAVISGDTAAALTETNAALITGGTLLADDVDNPDNVFQEQTDVAGSNSYGKFSINAAGAWSYTMDSAHDEFVMDQVYTDSIMVKSADGTEQVVTVTMTGTNDAAVISGDSSAALTESDVAQSTGGQLYAADVDNANNVFQAQTDVAGSNGYGKFSIDAGGVWTYAMNSAHDQFVKGQEYTDSITVKSADGTEQVVTVTMTGTNDAAVISGDSTAALTESDAAQSTGGQLYAADVDNADNVFQAQTDVAGSSGYGKFSIDTGGVWTYAMDSAHDEFVKDQDYTDSITFKTEDGSEQIVTVSINGTNDAAVISGDVAAALTESNVVQTTGGTLLAADVDNADNVFQAQTDVAGSNGYGKFSIDAGGAWTYAMDSAHDEFVKGQDYADSITVQSVDGTEQIVTVTIEGTNDSASITGTNASSLTEDGATLTATGTLTVADLDAGESAFAAVDAADLQGTYGSFTFDGDTGAWGYALDNGSSTVQALNGGQLVEDKLTVTSLDGTATQDIVVSISGANEAATVLGYTLPGQPTTTTTFDGNNTGPNQDDNYSGTTANNLINGNNGQDTLSGGAGDDIIYGGNGADKITGGTGFDYLYGENSNDTFYYSNANEATDVITGFQVGGDKLNFSGAITSGGADYSLIPVDTNANGSADATLVRVDSNGAAAGGTLTDMVVLVGVTNVTSADIVWTA